MKVGNRLKQGTRDQESRTDTHALLLKLINFKMTMLVFKNKLILTKQLLIGQDAKLISIGLLQIVTSLEHNLLLLLHNKHTISVTIKLHKLFKL